MNYKLGLASVSFRSHSAEEILTAMKAAGLSDIEWGSDVHAPKDDFLALEKIVALQKAHGIFCCSYGTYFRLGVTPIDELSGYIQAAGILGTKILRLWCGDKNSEEYTQQEKTELLAQCRAAAALAEKRGVVLCMECHNNTYTNTKESAYELMQTVNSESFRMYWQPNQYRSEEENIQYAKMISPYAVNLHVFNWKGDEKYPLRDAKKIWRDYLACFPGAKYLLLEFMPDGQIASLSQEVAALRETVQ